MLAPSAPPARACAMPATSTDINVNEPVQIDYWVDRFGVTEESLRKAIADVGVCAQEVAEHLGRM